MAKEKKKKKKNRVQGSGLLVDFKYTMLQCNQILYVERVAGRRAEESFELTELCNICNVKALRWSDSVQVYLAHKNTPNPLGPPEGPRLSPTVGS